MKIYTLQQILTLTRSSYKERKNEKYVKFEELRILQKEIDALFEDAVQDAQSPKYKDSDIYKRGWIFGIAKMRMTIADKLRTAVEGEKNVRVVWIKKEKMIYCVKCGLPFLDRGDGLCSCFKPEWVELEDLKDKEGFYIMNPKIKKLTKRR